MTSLADLTTDLSTRYLRDPNNKLFPVAQCEDAIQEAYTQVQQDTQYSGMDNESTQTPTIVAGTSEYALASDFVSVRLVTYNGAELRRTTKEELRRMNTSLTTQGTPGWYYLYNNKIGLYPTPNSSGTALIEYNKKLPTLTSGQGSVLPTNYDSATLAKAAHKLWLPVNYDKAMMWLEEYEKKIDSLKLETFVTDQNLEISVAR